MKRRRDGETEILRNCILPNIFVIFYLISYQNSPDIYISPRIFSPYTYITYKITDMFTGISVTFYKSITFFSKQCTVKVQPRYNLK